VNGLSVTAAAHTGKKEYEKAEWFRKIEPYLTYLDFVQLEARGAGHPKPNRTKGCTERDRQDSQICVDGHSLGGQ